MRSCYVQNFLQLKSTWFLIDIAGCFSYPPAPMNIVVSSACVCTPFILPEKQTMSLSLSLFPLSSFYCNHFLKLLLFFPTKSLRLFLKTAFNPLLLYGRKNSLYIENSLKKFPGMRTRGFKYKKKIVFCRQVDSAKKTMLIY